MDTNVSQYHGTLIYKIESYRDIISFGPCACTSATYYYVTIVSGINTDFETDLPRNLDYKQNVNTLFPVINMVYC